MPPTGFYMEEKVDGERIQMHMDNYGATLRFYSRKAKDYTYLYGNSFEDTTGSLSKHLKQVISPKVKNCILDGEMVAWDPQEGVIVAFGTLKTAALNEKRDAGLTRPMCKLLCVSLSLRFLSN
jgi:DNA ligase 4